MPEKEKIGSEIEYQNQIMFEKYDVNLIYYTEKKINAKGEEKITELHGLQVSRLPKTMPEKSYRQEETDGK